MLGFRDFMKADESWAGTAGKVAAGMLGADEIGVNTAGLGRAAEFLFTQSGARDFVTPLSRREIEDYKRLCQTKPATGLGYRDRLHNHQAACTRLCQKVDRMYCANSFCKPVRVGSLGYKKMRCPGNFDFVRDPQSGRILGLD